MGDATEGIAGAEGEALETLLKAVLRRYAEVYPDWEMNLIALPKDENRDVQIDRIIKLRQKLKRSV